ncbi:hypothetical protein FX987_02009 [Vreelandella titanicae]|uniref:Uncharacterized protein n=1 Tax=Vreelandella titanicae TaxID=664683 RepID=A0AAP9NMC4_9GAMM|nr:hypothetical protein FX987_02009 [Halomonas titanicae]
MAQAQSVHKQPSQEQSAQKVVMLDNHDYPP